MVAPEIRTSHRDPPSAAAVSSHGQFKQHWGRLALLCIFGVGFGFYFYNGSTWFDPAVLRAHEQTLQAYTASHYWRMLSACVFFYVLTTALSIPGAWMRSLVTGFLFGSWVGSLIIIFSATLGAVLTLLAVRYLFADRVRDHFEKNPGVSKLINGFNRDAFNYLLFLRLVPLFPFELVNLAPAFTPVSVRTFAAATAIGITPGSYALATLGQSMGLAQTMDNPLSLQIIILLVLMGLLVLVPVILKRTGIRRGANK